MINQELGNQYKFPNELVGNLVSEKEYLKLQYNNLNMQNSNLKNDINNLQIENYNLKKNIEDLNNIKNQINRDNLNSNLEKSQLIEKIRSLEENINSIKLENNYLKTELHNSKDYICNSKRDFDKIYIDYNNQKVETERLRHLVLCLETRNTLERKGYLLNENMINDIHDYLTVNGYNVEEAVTYFINLLSMNKIEFNDNNIINNNQINDNNLNSSEKIYKDNYEFNIENNIDEDITNKVEKDDNNSINTSNYEITNKDLQGCVKELRTQTGLLEVVNANISEKVYFWLNK